MSLSPSHLLSSRKSYALQAVAVFLLAFLLTGCATLNREQCQRGDWKGIGMADGLAGEPANRMDQHVRACSEFGIRIDNQQYLTGYGQGLNEYCQIDNAFESGLQGKRYQNVCPPSIDAQFERGNRAAYEVYRIRRNLDSLESQIDSLETLLYRRDLSDDYRRQLRHDLRRLDRQHDQLRDDLYSSQRFLDRLMDEVRTQPIP
jgi:hypothetical protein